MYFAQPDGENRKLWRFHGGLHLPDNKDLSSANPVRKAVLPTHLILPLQQHIGSAAETLVAVGDRVLKGQTIAKPMGYVSAPIHAPTSGNIREIGPHPVAHPSGLSAPCIIIEPDGEDRWSDDLPEPILDFTVHDAADLRERIRWAGIVGLGGAAFPSSVKLNPGPDTPIHTLVINGAECEPYITCDDLLMREQPERVMEGIRILMHMLKAERCLIAIEDNKPAAIEAMYRCSKTPDLVGIKVVRIPTLYPSGGEKQLIKVLTGKEVPSNGLPAQLGIICHNVGTAAAVADAVLAGRPLISRVVTLTGAGIAEPQNLDALIGTPASELVAQAGGYTEHADKLILGGPMMGFTLPSDDVPITKAGNCLLAASETEAPTPGPASPCIRCGECARVCPANLLPQQMYWYARAKNLDSVQDYHLFDCIECGCCSHICPAHIPLVQYFRFAKTESWAQEQEKRKADHAKLRHDFREARIQRQEEERKARLRKKKDALKKKPPTAARASTEASAVDPKKAAIEAARKRAEEKKKALAEQGVAPKNVQTLNAAQQKQVDAAEARRKAVSEETRDGVAEQTTD